MKSIGRLLFVLGVFEVALVFREPEYGDRGLPGLALGPKKKS